MKEKVLDLVERVNPELLTPQSEARVSIRADDVLIVEDLTKDNPEWGLNRGVPRWVPDGCVVRFRGSAQRIKLNQDRADVLAAIDPDGKLFVEFTWRDADGTKG